MRTLFGWLLLFGMAALAGWGFSRWRAEAETRAEAVTGVSDVEELPGIPARVLIGGPSGAAPVRPVERLPLEPEWTLSEEGAPSADEQESPPPLAPTVVQLTVRPGSTLSTLCQEFYTDPGRPPLNQVVDAVTRWNGLANANDLRAGEVLELPPLSSLFP